MKESGKIMLTTLITHMCITSSDKKKKALFFIFYFFKAKALMN